MILFDKIGQFNTLPIQNTHLTILGNVALQIMKGRLISV